MTAPAGSGSSGAYFFVSYAQVPPAEGGPSRSDPLVDRFFADLVAGVGRHATDATRRIGLYDKTLEPGRDWATAVGRALGEAEVLVALYSPRYVTGLFTRREHRSFEERIRAAHADPARHIQPVLWMPFPAGMPPPADGVEDLGAEIPEYEAMGLGALCDVVRADEADDGDGVSEYRAAYERVVERLAQRIVEVAERSPIGPSAVSGPAESDPVAPETADFVIAVFAPNAEQAPPGGDPAAYASEAVGWAPFASTRPVPIARQATYVTERLDVNATVTAVPAVRYLWQHKPAILLVDAWLAADRRGAAALLALLKRMPPWVVPLAVTDRDDGTTATRAAAARAAAVAMLIDAGADPAVAAAEGFDRFMDVMPTLVARARRRFFNEMPSTYPGRRRLGGSEPSHSAMEGDDR
ncbi:TIR-like protein FxsC [Plantactinospora endophytica]|uniref:TIR domain-containing protein n=1 Tax=Plantactinospora endophytica TaxID=673535 RepID=A0ABQ4E1F4_9ACTN|nr:TIR-like protein FxsC [Plantactinospora endophytica]GIG88536.1 hypothetical protein Pen02_34720 [Plantactinospora endophytica]